jgi:hypothetical protein
MAKSVVTPATQAILVGAPTACEATLVLGEASYPWTAGQSVQHRMHWIVQGSILRRHVIYCHMLPCAECRQIDTCSAWVKGCGCKRQCNACSTMRAGQAYIVHLTLTLMLLLAQYSVQHPVAHASQSATPTTGNAAVDTPPCCTFVGCGNSDSFPAALSVGCVMQ